MTGPLVGQRVVVTRRPEQSGELMRRLEALGARVQVLPAITLAPPADTAPLDAALRRLDEYDYLVLTSANAVEAVARRLEDLALEAPQPGPTLASVGPATSEACRRWLPDRAVRVQPVREFRGEGLLQAFAGLDLRGKRVLLPASERARDVLPRGLRARGAAVDVCVAYRNVAPEDLAARLAALVAEGVDLVVFASPSAVEHVAAASPELAAGLRAAVIGPVTERAARAAGLDVQVVASPSTVDGLVAALAGRR